MQLWLIIDLEATTEEGGWPLHEMEIIEIGATLATSSGHEVAHFQRFIKPTRRPYLTTFCRNLTHIQQQKIDNADNFKQVWTQFEHWLSPHLSQLIGWGSWGDYDHNHLKQECQHANLNQPLKSIPHHNLKKTFSLNRQIKRPVGLQKALQLAGLAFQGQQHRALTDARNTARLLPLIFPHQG